MSLITGKKAVSERKINKKKPKGESSPQLLDVVTSKLKRKLDVRHLLSVEHFHCVYTLGKHSASLFFTSLDVECVHLCVTLR
mmetsp:Transcript_54103/g.62211  ORF Transcript_54103/g.62211 Transcript_54103/m.62211 type:complete len:82 (-) Transcript_54103:883-1128(-)